MINNFEVLYLKTKLEMKGISMKEKSERKKGIETKKLVILALMVSQAMVLSIVESWIPMPSSVPGVKPGLANIITLTAIIIWGLKEAFIIMIIRTVATSFFTGGIFALLFSIVGGTFSIIVMYILHRKLLNVLSVIGISIAGSVTHNISQLAVAAFVMEEVSVFAYLPVLLISGVIMGIFTGACTGLLVKSFALKELK